MSSVAMTGSDTIVINGRSLLDLADGNCVELIFEEDIANQKTGKNGNSIYSLNESGRSAKVTIRIVKGSSDDKFLNNLFSLQGQNFAAFPLMFGTFIKQVGNGQGNITSDTYILNGGIFTKGIDAKTNVEGEADQSVSVYNLKFSNAPRVLT